jgi:flagellar biosynthesis/type III secretory pathway M-ring protein FliF/YscJ
MIVLALLLIIGAVLVAVGVLLNATGDATLEAFGVDISTNEGGLFIAGAATMLAFLLGLWLLAKATARARRRRSEVKNLKRSRSSEVERLQAEKAELEEEVRRERTSHADPDSSVTTGTDVSGGHRRIHLTEAERQQRH